MTKYFITHPTNLAAILSSCKAGGVSYEVQDSVDASLQIAGIPLYVNEHMKRWRSRWVFPKSSFFEYEPSDEPWCRFFGFGHLEDIVGSPLVMSMNDVRHK